MRLKAIVLTLLMLVAIQLPCVGQTYNSTQISDFTNGNDAYVTSGNALKVDVASSSGTANVNVYQVGGSSTATGNGIAGTGGVQRVTIASDSTGQITLAAGSNLIGSVSQSGTWNIGTVTTLTSITNPVAVTGTFWQATQPVSGTVAVTQSTSPWVTSASQSGTWNIGTLSTITNPVAVTGTFWQATQPISAASLPLPTGAATAAKQPALGTAGTASSDVITVQGIASMTALKVDGSAVTQPVSGTFWQATQPVSIAAAVPVTDNAGSLTVDGTVAATQSGTWTVQPGNTANTTPWLMSISQGGNTATVDGTGALKVTGGGGGTQYAEDTAHASGDTGTLSLAVRNDSLSTTLTSTNGDYSPIAVDNKGAIQIRGSANSGTFANTLIAGNSDPGVTAMAVRNYQLYNTDVFREIVDQNYSLAYDTLSLDNLGALYVTDERFAGRSTSFQSNATATGNGNYMNVAGTKTVKIITYDSPVGSAQVTFEGSTDDGSNWESVVPYGAGSATATIASTTNTSYLNTEKYNWIRVRISSYTSGGINSYGSASQAYYNHYEDTAHISGDPGYPILAIRNDSNAALTGTDGDYSGIAVNSAGAVAIQDGGNSITVDGTVAATQSGTWNIGSITTVPTHAVTQSGTWTVQPGNTANTTPWLFTQYQGGSALSTTNGIYANLLQGNAVLSQTNELPVKVAAQDKATYSACSTSFTPGATPQDIFTITGSGTKTVKVLRVLFSSTAGALGTNTWFLKKRSTANSGGTSASCTAVPFDSNDAAATATVLQYTANPTAGTAVGDLWVGKVTTPRTGETLYATPAVLFDSSVLGEPITLRGTGEVLALNFNGASLPANLAVTVTVIWTEE